jgi:hypothetical protein
LQEHIQFSGPERFLEEIDEPLVFFTVSHHRPTPSCLRLRGE